MDAMVQSLSNYSSNFSTMSMKTDKSNWQFPEIPRITKFLRTFFQQLASRVTAMCACALLWAAGILSAEVGICRLSNESRRNHWPKRMTGLKWKCKTQWTGQWVSTFFVNRCAWLYARFLIFFFFFFKEPVLFCVSLGRSGLWCGT